MELELVYNEETREWEQKKEPFITIEVETEEDFEFIGNAIAFYKKHMAEQEKPQTNADRIRAMSDEELARHLHCIGWDCHLCAEHERLDNEPLLRDQKCDENCFEHCLEWLKQPAEV